MKSAILAPLLCVLFAACTPNRGGSSDAPAGSASQSAASVSAAGSAPSAAAAASALPVLSAEEQNAAQSIVVNDCLGCHAEELLQQQRLTPKQWGAVVKKMQGWGSLVEPSRVDMLVAFLSAQYSLSAPAFEPPPIDAAQAADAIARQPDGSFGDGDAKKGATTYKEGCASCHGASAQGSPTGVVLADRAGLWRAAEFARMVRNGRGRMPAFPTYSDADIAAILAYLRTVRPG